MPRLIIHALPHDDESTRRERRPIIQTAQRRRPAYETRDDPSNQSLPISNPDSGFAIWKLKSGGQRLTRKMRLRSPDNEKVGSQRLAASCEPAKWRQLRHNFLGGDMAYRAGTWLTETALAGWSERTRTRIFGDLLRKPTKDDRPVRHHPDVVGDRKRHVTFCSTRKRSRLPSRIPRLSADRAVPANDTRLPPIHRPKLYGPLSEASGACRLVKGHMGDSEGCPDRSGLDPPSRSTGLQLRLL
jgi:hypothetical protein